MLAKIAAFFKTIFKTPTHQEELDAFIAQHKPTSACDVEYWIAVFDRQQARGNLWIHTR